MFDGLTINLDNGLPYKVYLWTQAALYAKRESKASGGRFLFILNTQAGEEVRRESALAGSSCRSPVASWQEKSAGKEKFAVKRQTLGREA